MREMDNTIFDVIVCPRCGWTGVIEDLFDGICPECRYENGLPPYRLLTIKEMLEDEQISEYNDVRMDLFLASLFRILSRAEIGTTIS